MEEKKNDNKVVIIVLAILGGFLLLGIIIFVSIFLFTGRLWESVKQDINDQWEEISNEKNNSGIIVDDNDTELNVTLEEKINGRVVVYLFRGEGCSHCSEAEEWLDSIKDEYGNMFIVKDYEVWYNKDNAELMENVADSRGEDVRGVPYIIIGKKSWNGFTSLYEDEMLSEIKRVYSSR